jgi:hypothetical protein
MLDEDYIEEKGQIVRAGITLAPGAKLLIVLEIQSLDGGRATNPAFSCLTGNAHWVISNLLRIFEAENWSELTDPSSGSILYRRTLGEKNKAYAVGRFTSSDCGDTEKVWLNDDGLIVYTDLTGATLGTSGRLDSGTPSCIDSRVEHSG